MKTQCRYDALVPIESLRPFAKNRNQHTPEQIARLAKLLDYQGVRSPVVVVGTVGGVEDRRTISKGHGTIEAIRHNGWSQVPVVYQDFDDEEQLYAYVQSDNAIQAWAELDLAGIDADIGDLGPDFDIDMLGIRDFTVDVAEKHEGDPDAVPEPPKEAKTNRGELWVLGEHRLICGDSTDGADVDRLMGTDRADAAVTDPPYSVNYDRSREVRGGSADVHDAYKEADIDPTNLLSFIGLMPCDVLVMSYPIDRHFFTLAEVLKEYGIEFRKELVWVKDTFSFWMGSKYQQRHEPILWCARKGMPMGGDIPANQSTVFEFARPRSHDLHPTAKPIELWSKLVEYHVPAGGTVYEPFCGSGTTIIAAEMTGRRCRGIELSPTYVDVILTRWAKFTGKDPVREDGKRWSELNA